MADVNVTQPVNQVDHLLSQISDMASSIDRLAINISPDTEDDSAVITANRCQRNLRQPSLAVLKTLYMAAKTAFALAQQQSCLSLGESSLAPAIKGFLKSHLAVLLHVAGPAYGGVLHRSSTNRTDYLL